VFDALANRSPSATRSTKKFVVDVARLPISMLSMVWDAVSDMVWDAVCDVVCDVVCDMV
jgi:hypothetical protein